jgi:hypothetical protein
MKASFLSLRSAWVRCNKAGLEIAPPFFCQNVSMALKPAEHFPGDLTLFPKFAMVTINVFNR